MNAALRGGMRPALPVLCCLLTACGGDVAGEMERGIELTNHAIAFGLLASEGVAWVDAADSTYRNVGEGQSGVNPPGARHGAAGDCPTIERDPLVGEPFTLTAVYRGSGGLGCFSGSRLLPSTAAGSIKLEADIGALTMDFSSLELAGARVASGALAGTRVGDSTEHYSVSGELELPGTELHDAISADIHLTIDHRDVDAVTLSGHVEIADRTQEPVNVVLDHVTLDLADIAGECSVPRRGTATVETSPEIRVLLDGANKDDKVLVERRGRTSTPTRLCSFASDVF